MSTEIWSRFALIFGIFCAALSSACKSHAGLVTVPQASSRVVATPSALAVLTQSEATTGLRGDITFGDPSGRSALYLRFSPEWRARGAPLSGFLTLEPRAGAATDAEPVQITVWRVRSPWEPHALHSWSDKPELAPPYVTCVTSSSPAQRLRIDITTLLGFLAENPALDQGLALIAGPGRGRGASFSTGISGGAAPRLDVYRR